MRAVNLLPRDEPKRSFEAGRGVAFGAAGGMALVTVALSALMLGASGAIGSRQSELDALNAELASVPAPSAVDASTDAALVAEKALRVGALSEALAGRVAWDGVLRQISQVLPEDVWLTSLATSSDVDPAAAPVPGAVATGSRLTIIGSTYSHSGVARLLSRLSVLPALSSTQLQSSTATETGAQKLVQFTIVAAVKAPGASS